MKVKPSVKKICSKCRVIGGMAASWSSALTRGTSSARADARPTRTAARVRHQPHTGYPR